MGVLETQSDKRLDETRRGVTGSQTEGGRAWRPRERGLAVAIALAGLALVLAIANFEVELARGDDAEYLVWGKSIASGMGYRSINNPAMPPATLAPPSYPAFLAAIMRLFGEQLWICKAGSVACYVGSVILVYGLARRWAAEGDWPALVVPVVYAMGPIALVNASKTTAEMLFTLVSVGAIAVVFLEPEGRHASRWRPIAAALLAGAGLMIRSAGVALAAAIVLWYLWRRRWASALVFACVCTATMLPWSLHQRSTTGRVQGAYVRNLLLREENDPEQGVVSGREFALRTLAGAARLARAVPDVVMYSRTEGHQKQGKDVLLHARRAGKLVLLAGVAWGLVVTLRRKASPVHLYLLLYAALLSLWPHLSPRLLLPVAPFLIWLLVEGLVALGRACSLLVRKRRPVLAHGALALLMVYLAVSASLHSAAAASKNLELRGLSYWAPERYEPDRPGVANYARAGRWVMENTPASAVIVCRKQYQMHWWTGRRTGQFPFTRDKDAVWRRTTAMRKYGPVYVVVDRYIYGKTEAEEFLLPAIREYCPTSSKVYNTQAPECEVWAVAQRADGCSVAGGRR